MSHPARGPVRSTGIDGKTSAGGRRQSTRPIAADHTEASSRMSHPARGPVRSTGIDGKTSAGGRRQSTRSIAADHTEASPA